MPSDRFRLLQQSPGSRLAPEFPASVGWSHEEGAVVVWLVGKRPGPEDRDALIAAMRAMGTRAQGQFVGYASALLSKLVPAHHAWMERSHRRILRVRWEDRKSLGRPGPSEPFPMGRSLRADRRPGPRVFLSSRWLDMSPIKYGARQSGLTLGGRSL